MQPTIYLYLLKNYQLYIVITLEKINRICYNNLGTLTPSFNIKKLYRPKIFKF